MGAGTANRPGRESAALVVVVAVVVVVVVAVVVAIAMAECLNGIDGWLGFRRGVTRPKDVVWIAERVGVVGRGCLPMAQGKTLL